MLARDVVSLLLDIHASNLDFLVEHLTRNPNILVQMGNHRSGVNGNGG
jgi:hypothetical protein